MTKYFLPIIGFLCCLNMTLAAQEETQQTDATWYQATLYGSAGKGDHVPLWMASKQYGLAPIDANSGYLTAGVFHQQSLGNHFSWHAGVELAAVAPRTQNVFVHQAYAGIGYRSLLLCIGSKENHHSLWDQSLSSGDLVLSNYARPTPEINLSMPHFVAVPFTGKWLHIKGDVAVGKSLDSGYLNDVAREGLYFIENALWHHKSFYLQVKNEFPIYGIIGVQHWVQWGGTSTNPSLGARPHSIKDFVRVFCGKEGGSDASLSDQINALGNTYGAYDLQLAYQSTDLELKIYHQHFFEDKSGMIFRNGTDGLWGLDLTPTKMPWLNRIVIEYLVTRDQSGPFHIIDFDHKKYRGPGGGSDNYYNNGEYTTGVSYFGRTLGNPLFTSPAYNTDGSLGFHNNRMRVYYAAFSGKLTPALSYQLRYAFSQNWGTAGRPFLARKDYHSAMADITWQPKQWKGWSFTGAFAFDHGDLLGNNTAASLRIRKEGILKYWNK